MPKQEGCVSDVILSQKTCSTLLFFIMSKIVTQFYLNEI